MVKKAKHAGPMFGSDDAQVDPLREADDGAKAHRTVGKEVVRTIAQVQTGEEFDFVQKPLVRVRLPQPKKINGRWCTYDWVPAPSTRAVLTHHVAESNFVRFLLADGSLSKGYYWISWKEQVR